MLNQAQHQAVTAPQKSVLILAGAGSGKTTVLTKRIAHQIKNNGLDYSQILAVTFTNKAAREMSERLQRELACPVGKMWIGTFHSIGSRLLREHKKESGLKGFYVLDQSDCLKIISNIIADFDLDEKIVDKSSVGKFIDDCKNKGLRAGKLSKANDLRFNQYIDLYAAYEKHLKRIGALDFGDLILNAYELLALNPGLLNYYRTLFKAVHVDEFQDTNTVQYNLIKILTQGQNNLFAVGDDDQSIYGWRGANIENMLRFKNDFPDCITIKLEENYRSTQPILSAANQLIRNNPERLGKELFTSAKGGAGIHVEKCFNAKREADFIVEKIQEIGGELKDFAILYRNNALSRTIEESLLKAGIDYKIYGGTRFFERAEIKDALAYLRVLYDTSDDTALQRIINVPPRRIGTKVTDKIWHYAKDNDCSMLEAIIFLLKNNGFKKAEHAAVESFYRLIEEMSESWDLELSDSIKLILEKTKLCEYYAKKEEKVENLQELVSAAALFAYNPDEGMSKTEAFLLYSTLESEHKEDKEPRDEVQVMTLHKSKGLEFKTVFLVGIEENILPSYESVQLQKENPKLLEEERRLMYVGITRAKQRLFMSFADNRVQYGNFIANPPSRFLVESVGDFN